MVGMVYASPFQCFGFNVESDGFRRLEAGKMWTASPCVSDMQQLVEAPGELPGYQCLLHDPLARVRHGGSGP